jgi:hypothetical protein
MSLASTAATALATLENVASVLATHEDLVQAVIELVEVHNVDKAVVMRALRQVLKDASDAQMKQELGP